MSKPSPSKMDRLLPQPTPETRHFWDGTRSGELRLQRCVACSRNYFPPQPFCPHCHSDDIRVFVASGRGRLYGFNISHVDAPGLPAPYAIAVVELAEGPRMMSNLVDCAQTPEAIQLDMPLEVVFSTQSDEITLALFKPGRAS